MKLSTHDYVLNRPHPPPTWLNPQELGATELREIPRERIRIIDNGRQGLIEFFAHAQPDDVIDWEAFVINRGDRKGVYAYSNEQFWLAAAAAFRSRQFKLQLNRRLYHWLKDLPDQNLTVQALLKAANPLGRHRLLDLERADGKTKKALEPVMHFERER